VFNVSESNVLATADAGRLTDDPSDSVRLSRNQTDPNLLEDGVNSVQVARESSDRFRVEYGGYLSGRLWVTHDGVVELKRHFLDDRAAVPAWVLSRESVPDWFPAPGDPPDPVRCDDCGDDVPVTSVLTPLEEGSPTRYCPECWSSR
jgi:hypothetical protein